jgi:hypothetical protein
MIKIISKKIVKPIFFALVVFLIPKISLAVPNASFKLKNPLGDKVGSVGELIGIFVDWIINLGVVAVTLAFIFTGFQFVTARGDTAALQKARQSFFWTVIGALVLIGAKVLTEVIKNTLTKGGLAS